MIQWVDITKTVHYELKGLNEVEQERKHRPIGGGGAVRRGYNECYGVPNVCEWEYIPWSWRNMSHIKFPEPCLHEISALILASSKQHA